MQLKDIEQALTESLPEELWREGLEIASAIYQALNTQGGKTSVEISLADAAKSALVELAGREISLQGSALSFGKGNQLGDVILRDVAGRDIVNIEVSFLIENNRQQDLREETTAKHRIRAAKAFIKLEQHEKALGIFDDLINEHPTPILFRERAALYSTLWKTATQKEYIFAALRDYDNAIRLSETTEEMILTRRERAFHLVKHILHFNPFRFSKAHSDLQEDIAFLNKFPEYVAEAQFLTAASYFCSNYRISDGSEDRRFVLECITDAIKNGYNSADAQVVLSAATALNYNYGLAWEILESTDIRLVENTAFYLKLRGLLLAKTEQYERLWGHYKGLVTANCKDTFRVHSPLDFELGTLIHQLTVLAALEHKFGGLAQEIIGLIRQLYEANDVFNALEFVEEANLTELGKIRASLFGD